MANPQITTTIAHADPNATPITINELIDTLNPLVATAFSQPNIYIPYIISSDTPGSDDRDKAWIEIDSNQRPLSIKIWHPNSGAWRRVYNGMIGEVRMYFGNPGYDNNTASDFDVNGAGHIGGRYDGWQICNGKNGSPDFSNTFPVASDLSGSGGGFSNGLWKTRIEPGDILSDAGGTWTETLKPENIPFPATPDQVPIDHWEGDTGRNPAGHLYGRPDDTVDTYLLPGTPGNPTPVGVFIAPPFRAMALIIFQGY